VGINLNEAAKLAHLMSPEDQARFGSKPLSSDFYERHPEYNPVVPPPKTDKLERDEQRQFANQLLLWNSQGRKIPFVWHSTAHRSKATPGTPDFLVGINRTWLCIEFKRDYSYKLSAEQQEFCECCLAQGLVFKVVYSADEAIKLVEQYDSL
jgi:hypothetical protein